MDIVIVSEFCGDFSQTDTDRFLYLAKLLSKEQGNQIEIVTSTFLHERKEQRRKPKADWPFMITFIEEPGYKTNICLQRFRSHYKWGRNVIAYLKKRKKPDRIYCAVPSLTGPNLVAKYCEENRIRFIVDIQDLWPEAFQMIVNIPVISDLVFMPFRHLADGVYRRADVVCGVSETYVNRALKVNEKNNKGNTVFLGTDLSVFDRFAEENCVRNKTKNEIRLAYCGTLGSSYDLTCVIDALAILKDSHISFIVMGDGPRTEEFRDYAKKKGVKAEFTGRVPYDQMCGILKSCDITINPITHNAAQSIINKHADYAASGLPVLSTQECEEYRKLVEEYQMGYNCRNNDTEDLAKKLKILIDDPELRERMGKNARRCAEERFDRKNSYHVLVKAITA